MRRNTGKRYTHYKRSNSPYWYAEIKNPKTGKYMSPRSTREKDESAALLVIADWIKNGLPEPHGKANPLTRAYDLDALLFGIRTADLSADDARKIVVALQHQGLVSSVSITEEGPLFIPWLLKLWDFALSPYVREKLAHGQKISHRRCLDASGAVRKHWQLAFTGKKLHEITKTQLRDFAVKLAESGLSAGSVNKIMTAGNVPLRWAANNDLIESDPTKGLRKFAGTKKKRGILSETEADKILSLPWDDERARVGTLLASQMGLRAGEVLGLRVQDLGTEKLHVRNAWSATDGLKGTKTDHERHLLWAPGVREELVKLANNNPHGTGPGMYVFCSTLPDRPMDNHVLLDGLKTQFVRLKAKGDSKEDQKNAEELRKDRNIVFHSWRHYTAAQLRARGVPLNLAMDYMGHGSQEVYEAYADHETEAGDKILKSSMGWAQ